MAIKAEIYKECMADCDCCRYYAYSYEVFENGKLIDRSSGANFADKDELIEMLKKDFGNDIEIDN